MTVNPTRYNKTPGLDRIRNTELLSGLFAPAFTATPTSKAGRCGYG